ncbi:MAG: beta-lactamase family protein [Chitinophagaceae bacterium]|nr:beta-lactamase family protein [Chitinophagaceae bacterium]
MKYIFCLFTLVAFLSVNAQKGIPVAQMSHCDNLVTAFLTKYDIPGASFALSKAGKIVYMRSFGYADKEKTILTQPHNLYRIASLSKPVTSIAIMKMMQNGLLTMTSKVFGPGGILQETIPRLLL